MSCIDWSGLWLRIHYASLLVWDFLLTVSLRLANRFHHVDVDIPLPVTFSSRRPSDANLAFPFPALRKSSRHSSEFEASQQRLRHSVRLQRMGLRVTIPKRCETPLLPFHSIPGAASEDGDGDREPPTIRRTWTDHDDVISSPSSPSFSLNTPLSTSNALHAADPFAFHGDSFYTPSDRGSILSPVEIRDSLDLVVENRLTAFRDPTKPSQVSRNGFFGESACRRQFCACRHPCSDFVSVSPIFGTPPLNSKRISTSTIPRRHSFDADPFADPTTRVHGLTDHPLLATLDLVVPGISARIRPPSVWTMKSCTPRQSILEGRTATIIASPPLAFRHSDVYDAWLSSWCFRPTIPGAPRLPVPGIMVSSAPQFSPFLPSCTSSPKAAPTRGKKSALGGLTYLAPTRMAARDSRVVSGMNKLQNLRDLLALLDETMVANAGGTQENTSLDDRRETFGLGRKGAGPGRRLGIDGTAGRAM